MSSTVVIVMPEWMLYGLALILALSAIRELLGIYVRWLEKKVANIREKILVTPNE